MCGPEQRPVVAGQKSACGRSGRISHRKRPRVYECYWAYFAAEIHLVAVGTAFTGRPPQRSVQARLRTRLLRRMSGVEASLGIGMQDAGLWDPSVEDWRIFRPLLSRGLTAANQNVSP